VRIAAERLHVEGVPAFFQVGQEYRVVDVPQCVDIPPPQADPMLEDRVHMPTLSPPGTANDRQRDSGADPATAAGPTEAARREHAPPQPPVGARAREPPFGAAAAL
jgi:hypothetical protein